MATMQELKTALVRAHTAGDTDSARKLAKLVRQEESRQAEFAAYPPIEMLPDSAPEQVPGTVPQQPGPSLGQVATGAAEAGLTTVTGATSGTAGMLGFTLKGIADELLKGEFGSQEAAGRIQQQAMEGMQKFTYAPRTETGQQFVETIGEVGEALTPLAPMTAELGMIGQSARAVGPMVRTGAQAVQKGASQAVQKAKPAITATKEKIQQVLPEKKPAFGEDTAGAARVDRAELAQAQASELDIPIDLTKGQASGKFEDIRFERETAKISEEGAPFRERYAKQNEQIQDNLDKWIFETGAEASERGAVGELVQTVLKERKERDKNKVRALYREARKSEEAKQKAPADRPVKIVHDGEELETSVVDYLNSRPSGLKTSGVTDDAKALGVKLGVLEKDNNGIYRANPNATVNDLEDLRVEISAALPKMATDAEIRDVTILKRLIDNSTEPVTGPLFRRARQARRKVFEDYVNNGLVKRLVGTKRGTDDRAIAVEDVVNKVILQPSSSLEDMRKVRRLLQTKTGGPEGTGAQAWKELQGATLRHIQEKMLNMQIDDRGNKLISPAKLDRLVQQLDKTGKLDFLFGKKGAEKLRTINEVAQRISLAPAGAVNNSNTATVLAGLMDLTLSASTGIPAPLTSGVNLILKQVKDQRLKAKIREHLGQPL